MAQTILAVDDEKDIAEMLKYYFTKQGYRVITAQNGKDALKFAEKKPAHFVLAFHLGKHVSSNLYFIIVLNFFHCY